MAFKETENMNRAFTILNFILLALLLLAPFALAHTIPTALDSLILEGKQQIYRMEFQAAEETFREARSEYPDYPHGYVYQAYITALFFALDQANDSLARQLDTQISAAMEVAKDYKSRFNDSAGSYFHLALANSIKALYHIIERSYVKGYFSGRSAKSDLEKVVQLDSTYYDAYIGLGLFHYYADLLPGFIKFVAGILGFEGNRVKGKAEIHLTAARGKYFKVESEFLFYCIGYFLEGDKANAIRALKQMYRQYPTNQGLGLILAYHARRSGYIQECMELCRQLLQEKDPGLPQVTDLKYYNLAVCYYDLNEFAKADSLFDVLNRLPTRKSLFYQAAIAYYKGHLADLRFERETALRYYRQIPDHKQTKYWYGMSRALIKYPTDSLMYQYFTGMNLLGSRQFGRSLQQARALKEALDAGKTSANPDMRFLTISLLASNYYTQWQLTRARSLYEEILPRLDKMEDRFRRAWIYIDYQRCLRELKEYKLAETMLKQAEDADDDYTRIIIEREKFILKQLLAQEKQAKPAGRS